MAGRSCDFVKEDGERCQAPPLHESAYCFVHDPENAEAMAEARRLGGLRTRKEKAVQGAFDVEGLDDAGQIRRLLMIAAVDALSLDNTIARARTLVLVAQAAAKLLEAHELEERLEALESTLKPREEFTGSRRRRR